MNRGNYLDSGMGGGGTGFGGMVSAGKQVGGMGAPTESPSAALPPATNTNYLISAPKAPAPPTTAPRTPQTYGTQFQSTPLTPAAPTPATAGASPAPAPATTSGNNIIAPPPAPPSWWNPTYDGDWGTWMQSHVNDPNWQTTLHQMHLNPPGANLDTNDPNNPFYNVNMSDLQKNNPWLYQQIMKITGPNPGQLGSAYKTIVGQLGRAITGPDVFSQNDVRNAGQAEQNQGAAGWYNEKQGLNMSAALSDSQDTGAANKYIAQQGAAADLATQNQVKQTTADLLGYNAQYRQQALRDAISALNQWAANRRGRRMSNAGADAMAAAASALASAQSQAAAWQTGSSILGLAGSIAGGAGG